MTKTPNLSVLVLALALTILSGSAISASAIEASHSMRSTQLEQAIMRAKKAQTLAESIQSTTYAGLDLYLERLLREAEADYIMDEEELIAALNDAATATELLLGVNRQDHNAMTEQTLPASNSAAKNSPRESNGQAVAQSQTIKPVAVTETPVSQTSELATTEQPDQVLEENITKQPEAVAELPNTGVAENKINIAGFVLAGVTAAISAIAITVIILRSKRRD